MRKYLIIFLFLVIFVLGVWLLNNFGVISIKAWGEKAITSTPFLEEYVKTDREYSAILTDKQQLEARNKELEEICSDQKAALQTARQQINSQQKKITTLEEELTELQQEKNNQKQRIDKLVEIYSQMDPEKAAEIIILLDRELSLILLTRLEDEQAAAILSELPSDKAVELTEAINE